MYDYLMNILKLFETLWEQLLTTHKHYSHNKLVAYEALVGRTGQPALESSCFLLHKRNRNELGSSLVAEASSLSRSVRYPDLFGMLLSDYVLEDLQPQISTIRRPHAWTRGSIAENQMGCGIREIRCRNDGIITLKNGNGFSLKATQSWTLLE